MADYGFDTLAEYANCLGSRMVRVRAADLTFAVIASHQRRIEKRHQYYKLARTHDLPRFGKGVGCRRITNVGKWLRGPCKNITPNWKNYSCRRSLHGNPTDWGYALMEGWCTSRARTADGNRGWRTTRV